MSRLIDDQRRYDSDLIAELNDEIATRQSQTDALKTQLKDKTAKIKGALLLMAKEKARADKFEADSKMLKMIRDTYHDGFIRLTMMIDEHPEDYGGACLCKTCQSYGD